MEGSIPTCQCEIALHHCLQVGLCLLFQGTMVGTALMLASGTPARTSQCVGESQVLPMVMSVSVEKTTLGSIVSTGEIKGCLMGFSASFVPRGEMLVHLWKLSPFIRAPPFPMANGCKRPYKER